MSLNALQHNFKEAALSDQTEAFLRDHLPYKKQESRGRFAVYQNNIIENLVGVLSNTYSACVTLVGKDFFNQSARQFIQHNLPQEPALSQYGKGFDKHFDTLGKQQNYAYWGEVAAFEWAENECYFWRDVDVLTPQDLITFDEETFATLTICLSPAIKLLKTEYNSQDIINIVRNSAPEEEIPTDFKVIKSQEHYVFYRTERKVMTDKISPVVFGALESLTTPISMADLAEKFSQQGCDEHFRPFIQLLFEKELIEGSAKALFTEDSAE